MPKLEVFLSHRTTEMRFADLIKARIDQAFFGTSNLYDSNDITSDPGGTSKRGHDGGLHFEVLNQTLQQSRRGEDSMGF